MDLFLPCLYSFLACIGFCIIFNIHGKIVFYASLGGALGWFVFFIFAVTGSEIIQYFCAMVALALYSEIMARIHKVPATLYLIAGVIPLVPGSGIYYTMEYFLYGNTTQFLSSFIHTLAIAGSLAFGILVVSSVMRIYQQARIKLKIKNNKAS